MTDELDRSGIDDLARRTAEAAAALEGLKGPASEAAAAIEAAFDRAGEGLARSLARAAADGEVSLAELARAVLAAVNAAAGTGGGGLSAAIASVAGSIFAGARAEGGPVSPGGGYLVGERGPEVFRPAAAGAIEPAGGQGVTVNVRVEGGVESVVHSEAQIAQALARAVSLGVRRL